MAKGLVIALGKGAPVKKESELDPDEVWAQAMIDAVKSGDAKALANLRKSMRGEPDEQD